MQPGAILVFAREPAPGRVKTRLTPPLSPEGAAGLYEAFVEDVLRCARRGDGVDAILLGEAVSGAAPRLAALARAAGVPLRLQRGADLGERLRAAFAEALSEPRPYAIALGGDHPTIPSALLGEARARLENGAAAAIIPSEDGGYCAIGLSILRADVFARIPWSTSAVLEATLDSLRRGGVEPAILPAWHDIDTAPDLERLRRELASLDPSRDDYPAATAAALRALGPRPGPARDRGRAGTAPDVGGATPRISPIPKGVDP